MSKFTRTQAIGSIIGLGALASIISFVSLKFTMNASELLGQAVGLGSNESKSIGVFVEASKIILPVIIGLFLGTKSYRTVMLLSVLLLMAMATSFSASYWTIDSFISKTSTSSSFITELEDEIAITKKSYEKNVTDGQRGSARKDRDHLDKLRVQRDEALNDLQSGSSNWIVSVGDKAKVFFSVFIEFASPALMFSVSKALSSLSVTSTRASTETVIEVSNNVEPSNDEVEPASPANVDEDMRAAILNGADINYESLRQNFKVGKNRVQRVLQSMESSGEIEKVGRKFILANKPKLSLVTN